MQKVIARSKMSRKARKQLDRVSRLTWGGVKPMTRIQRSGKAYDRRRDRAAIRCMEQQP